MKYVIAVVIASIAYGFLPIFVKNARVVGMSANSIVFYRFFFTAIACFFIILATKKSFKTTKKQMIEMSFYGIFGTGLTMLFVTMSLDYISTGLANMLHFGYPAVVMMTMIFIFKEKATPFKIISIILSITGLVILSQIKSDGSLLGIVLALITTITYSAYIIANKKASFSSLDTIVILFYVSIALSIFFFLKAAISGDFHLPTTIYVASNLIGISLMCTVFSLGILMYGVKKLGSSTASVLNMFEPTTTIILGIIIYNEHFNLSILIGSLLIIVSTVFIVIDSQLNPIAE